MWGETTIAQGGAFPSAPVVSGESVYIASGGDTVYALSIAD
ncbi:MAG TPA: PQQ-binding-like beta-propeller repeat protein [Ktedonobacterales bacterium]|jgi:hypothetical protein|nr:PQQ-binding-like beta-propeller repeat protein [Ktedonobacterales bacterium]